MWLFLTASHPRATFKLIYQTCSGLHVRRAPNLKHKFQLQRTSAFGATETVRGVYDVDILVVPLHAGLVRGRMSTSNLFDELNRQINWIWNLPREPKRLASTSHSGSSHQITKSIFNRSFHVKRPRKCFLFSKRLDMVLLGRVQL